jgi:hypothetical protein
MRFPCTQVGTIAAILILAALPASAGTINLAWDPVPLTQGYRVYYGTTPGQYAFNVDVGPTTQTTLTGLADCTTWYVAVKAYNSQGEGPQFSNEVSGWSRPRVTAPTPVSEIQGAQFTMDVTGANFQSGASVTIDNPDVSLSQVSIVDCNNIQLLAEIEPVSGLQPARIGRYTLTVTNPDSIYGDGVDVFEVRVDPSRFDLDTSSAATQGRLDGRDTIWLSLRFGTQQGDPGYDPDSDFDGDGRVDGVDLAYFAGSLGKCWSASLWNWTAAACPAGLQ